MVPQQGVKIGVTMGSIHRKLIFLYLILQIGIFFFTHRKLIFLYLILQIGIFFFSDPHISFSNIRNPTLAIFMPIIFILNIAMYGEETAISLPLFVT